MLTHGRRSRSAGWMIRSGSRSSSVSVASSLTRGGVYRWWVGGGSPTGWSRLAIRNARLRVWATPYRSALRMPVHTW